MHADLCGVFATGSGRRKVYTILYAMLRAEGRHFIVMTAAS